MKEIPNKQQFLQRQSSGVFDTDTDNKPEFKG